MQNEARYRCFIPVMLLNLLALNLFRKLYIFFFFAHRFFSLQLFFFYDLLRVLLILVRSATASSISLAVVLCNRPKYSYNVTIEQ